MKIDISGIIITKNEEKRIDECSKSLSFVDEIIVVDNGSTDKTVDIVKRYGAKIVEQTAGNFSQLRNKGAKKAKGKWLLYVDADERVTPRLRKEIVSLVTNHKLPITAYA
ncbi:MAG: glycosyltransferase, partial [Patescibacteria group bacterium]